MKTSQKNIIVVGLVGTVLAGWILIRPVSLNSKSHNHIADSKQDRKVDSQSQPGRAVGTRDISAVKESNQAGPRDLENESAKNQNTQMQIKKSLQDFKNAQAKLFKSPAEANLIRFMVRNRSQLAAATQLLKDVSLTQEENVLDRNAAVDLLLEALKSGDKQVATEMILDILQDNQVENKSLNSHVREALAETKAELMFHATSIPARTIENSLPGPVSQKIWDRVQGMQAENAVESELERQTYLAKGSRGS